MTDGTDDIRVVIRGQQLELVSNFVYLGSKLSRGNDLGPEISRRTGLAAAAFGMLRKPLWKKTEIDKDTKLQVYKAVVLPTLLYGAETWTTKQNDVKKLNTFHLRSLRSILNISWKDRWSNAKVLETCKSHGMPFHVSCARLRWLGHIARLGNFRLPKQLLFGRMSSARPAGGPLLRWSDCTRKDLKQASIPEDQWLQLAQDPEHWIKLIKEGLANWETESLKKMSLLPTGGDAPVIFSCSADGCQHQFLSHRGLAQHVRQKHRAVTVPTSLASAIEVAPTTSPTLFSCAFVGCDRQFSSHRGLAQHIRQKHHLLDVPIPLATTGESAPETFSCPMDGCVRQFPSHRGLAQHIRQIHNSVQVPATSTIVPSSLSSSPTSSLTCILCGKLCKNRSGLTRHVQHCAAPQS
ncbi:MAG: hypothetical protein WB421_03260 [Terriglobales bacterium]